MDKTLRTVIIACICVISFSIFYYLVIHLPREKEIERAATARKEAAQSAKELQRQTYYYNCTVAVEKDSNSSWEEECKTRGLGSGCSLPMALAESIKASRRFELERCQKENLQSQ